MDIHSQTRMIQNAELFATAAHAAHGDRRKYSNESYIVHPRAVAATVSNVAGSPTDMICAAWLHDTVEDTKISLNDIHQFFGAEIAAIVEGFTNVERSAGTRKERFKINTARLHLPVAR